MDAGAHAQGVTRRRDGMRYWEAHVWDSLFGKQTFVGRFNTRRGAAVAADVAYLVCRGAAAVAPNSSTEALAAAAPAISEARERLARRQLYRSGDVCAILNVIVGSACANGAESPARLPAHQRQPSARAVRRQLQRAQRRRELLMIQQQHESDRAAPEPPATPAGTPPRGTWLRRARRSRRPEPVLVWRAPPHVEAPCLLVAE